MTFSYTPPANGSFNRLLDEVRLLSHDTVESPRSVSDEDLAYYLQVEGQVARLAAADALEVRADRIEAANRQSITIGPFSTTLDAGSTAESLRMIAARLRSGGGPGNVSPVVGQLDQAYGHVFDLGMHDVRRPRVPLAPSGEESPVRGGNDYF